MASLVNKDSYLQKLAKKICTQEAPEPRKRKFGAGLGEDGTQPKKKKKRQKKPKMQGKAVGMPLDKQAAPGGSQALPAKPTNASVKKSGPVIVAAPSSSGSQTAGEKGDRSQSDVAGGGDKSTAGSFSAMNLLRQRLHEKIQEISGQGNAKELSPAVLEKRQRRKYERERKKRRRKELRMKEKTAKKEAEEASAAAISEPQDPKNDTKGEIVFNKVEVHEEGLSKAEKRKALKGNITPLTGKNYKQLLSRLESRKSKLEDLKDKDEGKAKELEVKMKWTNVLYKAEGVKIRDDEDRLKAALKRKEKRKAQRQRQWEKRTENVVKKMQQRQDKRRKNLQKKKMAKVEKKKAKARKKGRILPEDLEKANFK